jgi:hypothetical protein
VQHETKLQATFNLKLQPARPSPRAPLPPNDPRPPRAFSYMRQHANAIAKATVYQVFTAVPGLKNALRPLNILGTKLGTSLGSQCIATGCSRTVRLDARCSGRLDVDMRLSSSPSDLSKVRFKSTQRAHERLKEGDFNQTKKSPA